MAVYIFGYGSLLNQKSRAKTFAEAEVYESVVLSGYQRKLNAMAPEYSHVAMNIVPNKEMAIEGVVVKVSEEDFPALLSREVGYDILDISHAIESMPGKTVKTFICPDSNDYGERKAYRSYLNVCLGGVPTEKHDDWLSETIIECDILEDLDNPKYKRF